MTRLQSQTRVSKRIECKAEEESRVQPGDTIQWTPSVDSLLDSLRAPVETLPPTGASAPPEQSAD